MSDNGFCEIDRLLELQCGELLVGRNLTAFQNSVPALSQQIIEDDALKAVVIADGKPALLCKLGQGTIRQFKIAAAKVKQVGHVDQA